MSQESIAGTLALTRELARGLDELGVRFCHWKSNLAIARSESGENDLDLLVHQDDTAAFHAVLDGLGFVRTSTPGAEVPGTESFYGCSPDSLRWVNVHAHYQLVLGHDRTKNYRLPVEDLFLSSSRRVVSFLPTPPLELEYIVLVIRLVLKYSIADEIVWAALRGGRSRPKKTEQQELDDLRARIERPAVQAWLDTMVPLLDGALFTQCEAALDSTASVRSRVRAAANLERALQPYARMSRAADARARVGRRVELAARRRLRSLPGNRLPGGGAIVAVIGGDGSGKTTAIATTTRWLRGAFEVRQIHMGKPPWSVATRATRAALKVARDGAHVLVEVADIATTRRLLESIDRYRPLIWFALTARDRRRLHAAAHQFADAGGIVVSDRYPHEKLVEMDVPQVRRLTEGGVDNPFVRALMRYEETAHRSICDPDIVIVLRLDPDVAAVRKFDETPESVRRRGREVWTADWTGSGAHVVDASRSAEEVAADVRTIIWRNLK